MAEGESDDLLVIAQDWERRVAAIRERPQRARLLLLACDALPNPMLEGVLDHVVRRSAEGAGRAREVLQELALEPAVLDDLPYERREELYRLARERGDLGVMDLLRTTPTAAVNTLVSRDNAHLDLPLGLRRAAARATDRLTLDRLLHDRNPRVIEVLLDNPRLVERDVVRIAAMRPTKPEILQVVAEHARWASRYRVRKALVVNPHSPTALVVRLLQTLARQDVVDALEAGTLDPTAASVARRLAAGAWEPQSQLEDLGTDEIQRDLEALQRSWTLEDAADVEDTGS